LLVLGAFSTPTFNLPGIFTQGLKINLFSFSIKMPGQLKNLDFGNKPNISTFLCPFCNKGIRTDHYPAHLKTEMTNKNVSSAESMLKLLEIDGTDMEELLGLNILVKMIKKDSENHQYPFGVCFDCCRPIKNKTNTLTSLDVYDNHKCNSRIRKQNIVPEILKITPPTPEESKIFVKFRDTLIQNVAAHKTLSSEHKAILDYKFSEIQSGYMDLNIPDQIMMMQSQMLDFFVSKCTVATSNEINKIFLDDKSIKHMFDLDTPVIAQVIKYVKGFNKAVQSNAQGIKDAVEKAEKENSDTINELTIANTDLRTELKKLKLSCKIYN